MASKGEKRGNAAQGFLVIMVLLLATGGAGFGIGYTQKFVPIEMVAPDTASTASSSITHPSTVQPSTAPSLPAQSSSATDSQICNTGSGANSSSTPISLKKSYWIHTKGWDRAGYAINVFINNKSVGTFSTIDRLDDVTKLVKSGNNKIRFEAKALPESNRNDYTGAFFTVTLNQGTKFSANGYKDLKRLSSIPAKLPTPKTSMTTWISQSSSSRFPSTVRRSSA
ncbi:MAG: hypothetical protein K2X93_08570 [Candidatus Obscuribacterales bacterium]|nr:hypothetical protein [Candidatus Obscuribacterales bacterium]